MRNANGAGQTGNQQGGGKECRAGCSSLSQHHCLGEDEAQPNRSNPWPAKLLGAPTDQIANQHADSECHNQRSGEVVLHHFLGLLDRVDGAPARMAPLAAGDLAESSSGRGDVAVADASRLATILAAMRQCQS
jgi:hypothetical protein